MKKLWIKIIRNLDGASHIAECIQYSNGIRVIRHYRSGSSIPFAVEHQK
jgi:hypothetical protein